MYGLERLRYGCRVPDVERIVVVTCNDAPKESRKDLPLFATSLDPSFPTGMISGPSEPEGERKCFTVTRKSSMIDRHINMMWTRSRDSKQYQFAQHTDRTTF